VSVLQTKQPQRITLDLRKKTVYQMPRFIQHDTNILEIIIKDNGVDADLNNIGKIVVNYERPDKKVISRLLIKNESNKVEYKLGLEENEFAGLADIQIQFFSIDNQERISTTRFNVLLSASIGTDKIYENNGELSLLQELFVEVESIKQSAENEDARIENESQRQDAEAERNTKEIERQLAETSRIEAESTRLTSEQTRETNEAIRQQQEAARQNNTAQIISEAQQAILNTEIVTQYATESGEYAVGKGNEAQALGLYAKQQGDRAQQIVDENKTIWLKPVATFAAIATTYPNPVFGSKVITMDDQKEYRFTTIWEWTGIYSSNGVTALQAQLADANRQIQTLQHGTSIFASALNSPVEFEIQGRTLTSLGNSNLEGNKYYVLADKKTWIRAEGKEGTLIKGVGKFTKSASLISKSDLVGKVAGSVVENPHIVKYAISPTLQAPSAFTSELSTLGYGRLNTLNGTSETLSNSGNGNIVQKLFSKNIIEHIERKHGRIPADTVAGKVQWIKDNVQRLDANWHGWGSSVGGNKANVDIWYPDTNQWYINRHGAGVNSLGTNTSSSPSKVTVGSSTITDKIDSNGFFHILAHANPSDGVTPSQLNTDFIELVVELKSTAVLDTRPIITRVATFEGKTSGDFVANPHISKWDNSSMSLQSPSSNMWTEVGASGTTYSKQSTLDGNVNLVQVKANGYLAQKLHSFNLIEEVERNIGRLPKSTVAEKVQWIKDNVTFVFEWYGFGTSVAGSTQAVLTGFNVTSNSYPSGYRLGHSNQYVTKLLLTYDNSMASNKVSDHVDANGFAHWVVNAPASDGVTASTINTDYCELQITLKPGATLHDPILPLFEVDATDYAKILVDWNEAEVLNRYNRVMGTQHMQNLAVIAEGENLLPPFSEWTLHANAKVVSPYELELNATIAFQSTIIEVNGLSNQPYVLTTTHNARLEISERDSNGNETAINYTSTGTLSFTTKPTTKILRIRMTNMTPTGKFTWSNPMLTLGNTPKPFVPRNPSYLFAPVKLGQVGTTKDSLFKQDGQWTMVERVKKDVVLDGSLGWSVSTDFVGFKRLSMPHSVFTSVPVSSSNLVVTKYNGLKLASNAFDISGDATNFGSTLLHVNVYDVDSGLGETYNPNAQEMSAIMYGWQAKTTDGNGKPTAWRSLGDGTDAPTQTLAYVSTNKAPNFTPYKLSYALAAPQTTNVNHLVEGDIAVSGQTQVLIDSGYVNREKVVPVNASGYVRINYNLSSWASGNLKYKANRIIDIYKNGVKDTHNWRIITFANAYGSQFAEHLNVSQYDPTATYEVTYLVLERHLQTANAMEVKASYAGNFKEVVDDTVVKVSDLATQLSVLANQMYRVLVAAKGAGWNV
jgi:hypothetical protein